MASLLLVDSFSDTCLGRDWNKHAVGAVPVASLFGNPLHLIYLDRNLHHVLNLVEPSKVPSLTSEDDSPKS